MLGYETAGYYFALHFFHRSAKKISRQICGIADILIHPKNNNGSWEKYRPSRYLFFYLLIISL